MSEETASSTPKKRSRWEDDMPTEAVIPVLKKKKPKRHAAVDERPGTSPHVQVAQLSIASQPSSPRQSSRPLARPVSTRSAFVPPRTSHPAFSACRSVYCYERLNHIEEGSYGVVFRARDKATGDIVAIKKLKLDEEKNGFPITSLREVMALMVCRHEHVVGVREIVVGDTLTQVFIVMDFIEHDLKSLLSIMPTPFLQSEIKTLLQQLLSAVAHCHSNWVLHRDLKTSNLLMNNRGSMKVADFGLARTFGDPLGDMTPLVVTLWYRAPEILLGETSYSTAVDMWSVGCIFGELILKEPVFQAKGEMELLSMIFKLLGSPTEEIWPGFTKLPQTKNIMIPPNTPSTLRSKFRFVTEAGIDLISKLLTYDPEQRISAEEALRHPYFLESPLPKHPDMFGSFPSVAAGERRGKAFDSPPAPERMADHKLLTDFDDLV